LIEGRGSNLDQQIIEIFQRALQREPTQSEINILKGVHAKASSTLNMDEPGGASTDDYGETLKTPMAVVANVILNLDEFLTRQ